VWLGQLHRLRRSDVRSITGVMPGIIRRTSLSEENAFEFIHCGCMGVWVYRTTGAVHGGVWVYVCGCMGVWV